MNKQIEIIASFDDGREEDLKLARLLKKYNMPATFYIPSNCELYEWDIQDIARDFEIGGHSVSHIQDMKLITDDKELYSEIYDNKEWLEDIIKKPITKFCYPRGRFDERVKNMVKKAGFKSARTTRICNLKFPKDPFETDTAIHCSYPRKEYKGYPWLMVAKKALDRVLKEGGRFELWGHSAELSKFSFWGDLEKFLQYYKMKGKNEKAKNN